MLLKARGSLNYDETLCRMASQYKTPLKDSFSNTSYKLRQMLLSVRNTVQLKNKYYFPFVQLVRPLA